MVISSNGFEYDRQSEISQAPHGDRQTLRFLFAARPDRWEACAIDIEELIVPTLQPDDIVT